MDHLTIAQEKEFNSAFGMVTVKIPSTLQRIGISKRMQRYAEGLGMIDSSAWDLIEAFSTFDLCTKEAPAEWEKDEKTGGFNWDKVFDEPALLSLFKEVKEWLDSFRNPLPEQPTNVGKD